MRPSGLWRVQARVSVAPVRPAATGSNAAQLLGRLIKKYIGVCGHDRPPFGMTIHPLSGPHWQGKCGRTGADFGDEKPMGTDRATLSPMGRGPAACAISDRRTDRARSSVQPHSTTVTAAIAAFDTQFPWCAGLRSASVRSAGYWSTGLERTEELTCRAAPAVSDSDPLI